MRYPAPCKIFYFPFPNFKIDNSYVFLRISRDEQSMTYKEVLITNNKVPIINALISIFSIENSHKTGTVVARLSLEVLPMVINAVKSNLKKNYSWRYDNIKLAS